MDWMMAEKYKIWITNIISKQVIAGHLILSTVIWSTIIKYTDFDFKDRMETQQTKDMK